MILFIHVFGIRIPYTSESKEAIATVQEISEEIKAALKTAARTVKSFLNKREKRKKISEKFRLVSTIIPEISDKASAITGLERVPIEPVLSKVANVVFINETLEPKEDGIEVNLSVHNFTAVPRTFEIIADPPVGDLVGSEKEFRVEGLKPAERAVFTFRVKIEAGRYPGTDYYFRGIDPVYVNGAEPLPGDWNIQKTDVEEVTEDAE
jgi:DNA topoisomerase-6 subunit B